MADNKNKSFSFLKAFLIAVAVAVIVPVIFAFLLTEPITKTDLYRYCVSTPTEGLKPAGNQVYWQIIRHVNNPLEDLGLQYESVEFNAVDNSTLRGWFIPSANKDAAGIVLSHGAFVDRREVMRHASYMHDAGYHTLVYDFREHGISDGSKRGSSLGVREHQDVIAALDFMHKQKNITELALFGSSCGATSSIMAAAIDVRVRAVVAENPFSHRTKVILEGINTVLHSGNWGAQRLNTSLVGSLFENVKSLVPHSFVDLVAFVAEWRIGSFGVPNAIDLVAELNCPILLLHSSLDSMVLPAHSKALYSAAPEPKEFWLTEKGHHGTLYNEYGKEYSQRVLTFLARAFSGQQQQQQIDQQ